MKGDTYHSESRLKETRNLLAKEKQITKEYKIFSESVRDNENERIDLSKQLKESEMLVLNKIKIIT